MTSKLLYRIELVYEFVFARMRIYHLCILYVGNFGKFFVRSNS